MKISVIAREMGKLMMILFGILFIGYPVIELTSLIPSAPVFTIEHGFSTTTIPAIQYVAGCIFTIAEIAILVLLALRRMQYGIRTLGLAGIIVVIARNVLVYVAQALYWTGVMPAVIYGNIINILLLLLIAGYALFAAGMQCPVGLKVAVPVCLFARILLFPAGVGLGIFWFRPILNLLTGLIAFTIIFMLIRSWQKNPCQPAPDTSGTSPVYGNGAVPGYSAPAAADYGRKSSASKIVLNIVWHIPFAGFAQGIYYFIAGCLSMITIIGIPVGLGLIQFSKFLFAPFTCEMVSRKDLALVTGDTRSAAGQAFSVIARIFYFFPGLFNALGCIGMIIICCVTIIGIPCGMVWARALGTIFNPVDKVCVPVATADRIRQIKAGMAPAAQPASSVNGAPQQAGYAYNGPAFQQGAAGGVNVSQHKVRVYTDARLEEILSNPAMYNSNLVESCRKEAEIRKSSEEFLPQVTEMSDDEIMRILSYPDTYSEVMVYCCYKVNAERQRIREEEARKAEEERERQEAEAAAAAAARRKALWVKYRPYVFGTLALAAVLAVILYLISDSHHFTRGSRLMEKQKIEAAMAALGRVSNEKYRNYSLARYRLYRCCLAGQDSAKAAEALLQAVGNENAWTCKTACREYAGHALEGTFKPYIEEDKAAVAKLYYRAPDSDNRIFAGKLFLELGQYSIARNIFEDYPSEGRASGYLGIMSLYGWGGMEQDLDKAFEYLKAAPDELPFAVHKGDLVLYMGEFMDPRYGRTYPYHDYIQFVAEADVYYGIAAGEEPGNSSYRTRKEVTSELLRTYKTDRAMENPWSRSTRWNDYSCGSQPWKGHYYGMAYHNSYGNPVTSNGWGIARYVYSSDDSRKIVRLMKYSNGHAAGSNGISIDTGYTIMVGKVKDDAGNISSGTIIYPDGRIEVVG